MDARRSETTFLDGRAGRSPIAVASEVLSAVAWRYDKEEAVHTGAEHTGGLRNVDSSQQSICYGKNEQDVGGSGRRMGRVGSRMVVWWIQAAQQYANWLD